MSQNFVIAREPLSGILESGLPALLRAHWEEVAKDKDEIPLDPDWDEILRAERDRRFFAWSARRAGKLVGYNAFAVVRSLHYRTAVFAINDVIYLRPDERGVDGVRMIVEVEQPLKEMGVTKVFYHVKTDAELGTGASDSLEAIEHAVELEEKTGVALQSLSDRTLGGVLMALGYSHIENNLGKLLVERV